MPAYTEAQAREAIASSLNYSEALRKLGVDPHGGNHRLFRRWVDEKWRISTDHFDPDVARRLGRRFAAQPLEDVLVENSSYSRHALKQRLLNNGLKKPICELCGQGEIWRGQRLALILDHVNGVGNDNRLENLRIVCPNCAATLETHCGRKNKRVSPRECAHCKRVFHPRVGTQRYCSRECGQRAPKRASQGRPRVDRRLVDRPPFDQLVAEVRATGWSAVGRKYGVSDNAIRKWVRQYYRERELAEKEREDEAA